MEFNNQAVIESSPPPPSLISTSNAATESPASSSHDNTSALSRTVKFAANTYGDSIAQPWMASSTGSSSASSSSNLTCFSYPETSSASASPHQCHSSCSASSSAFVSASGSPLITSVDEEDASFDVKRPSREHIHSGLFAPTATESSSLQTCGKLQVSTQVQSLYMLDRSSSCSLPAFTGVGPLDSTSTSSFPTTSCDVYIGLSGDSPFLSRFAKWLRAELELQGIACFLADSACINDPQSHELALRMIESCAFGVVLVTKKTFRTEHSMQELGMFLKKKNLVPVFYNLAQSDCLARDIIERRGDLWEKHGGELWELFHGDEKEWLETLDGLSRIDEWKLEAHTGNWRSCILRTVKLLVTRLGRRQQETVGKGRIVDSIDEQIPLARNAKFVGRERELKALEAALFGHNIAAGESDTGQKHVYDSRLQIRRSSKLPWRLKQYIDYGCMAKMQRNSGSHFIMEKITDAEKSHDESDENRSNDVLLSKIRFQEPFSATCQQMAMVDDLNFTNARRGKAESIPNGVYMNRQMSQRRSWIARQIQHSDDVEVAPKISMACVSGVSGIGKTELVLEYAHRFAQRYRKVLWVGGETRYLRQNYLNMSKFLGLDVGTESWVGSEKGSRSFNDQEAEAIERVKRELQRNVPYLLIIDNVETERDWWDGRYISELIPRAGATHVIVTTRLPRLINMKPLELSYLSGFEALSLMKGEREFISQELDALREIERRLERLPLGLGIVGTLLSELPVMPSELLERMEISFVVKFEWNDREEAGLKNNSFLVGLLGICFHYLDKMDYRNCLSSRMARAAGWFGPYPIPISLLAYAASEKSCSKMFLSKIYSACFPCWASKQSKNLSAGAAALLIRCGLARKCSQDGSICFHELVQLYCRKRGGIQSARVMVHGMLKKTASATLQHPEHFWAACFLVLGFGNDPVRVELKPVEMLSFMKKGVVKLASWSFTSYSRCNAALELLRLSVNLLEDVERLFVSRITDRWGKTFCFGGGGGSDSNGDGEQIDEYVWRDITLLKAEILEMRAILMMKGGLFDAAEEICRTCISIRIVMLGPHHPDTISAQSTLSMLVRCRSNV